MQDLNYLELNGRLLRLFLLVYDLNSVSQAADQLDLNQSTVSHSLEKLRTCFSDPLFVKSGRGIVPTERAVDLAPRIRELLAGIEDLGTSLDYEPLSDTRPVVIASNVSAFVPLFMRIRDRLLQSGSAAPLRLMELGSRANIDDMLESGIADLVITVRSGSYSNALNALHFMSDDLVCYYDPAVRGPVRDALDYANADHAVVDFGSAKKSILEAALEENHMRRNIQLFAPSIESLARLIEGTGMIATMPAGLRFGVYAELAACPPPVPLPRMDVDMVWHRRTEHSGRGIWIRDLVLSARPKESTLAAADGRIISQAG